MRWLLIIAGGIVGLVLLILVLLVVHLVRSSRRQRRELLLKLRPVLEAISSGHEPDPEDLLRLAGDPQTRFGLYEALAEAGRGNLLPADYCTRQALGESRLVYWLTHPHELGAPPDEIELVRSVAVSIPSQEEVEYDLFRFRVRPPHWAADRGWMAGIAGPYYSERSLEPIIAPPHAFSELTRFESMSPEEHVRDLHNRVARRGGLKADGKKDGKRDVSDY